MNLCRKKWLINKVNGNITHKEVTYNVSNSRELKHLECFRHQQKTIPETDNEGE